MKSMQSHSVNFANSISVESMDVFVSADFSKNAKPEQYCVTRGSRMS